MIFKSITVIEHHDFFFGDVIFNNKPDFAMVRYIKQKRKIVRHDNLNHDIKMKVHKGNFKSFNLIDIIKHNIYYLVV